MPGLFLWVSIPVGLGQLIVLLILREGLSPRGRGSPGLAWAGLVFITLLGVFGAVALANVGCAYWVTCCLAHVALLVLGTLLLAGSCQRS